MAGKVDAVWVANDINAGGGDLGAGQERLKVPVSGQDPPRRLQNVLLGKQVATVYKPFQLEAPAAVDMSMKLLNGEKPTTDKTAADGAVHRRTPAWSHAKNMKTVFDDGNAEGLGHLHGAVADACQKAGLISPVAVDHGLSGDHAHRPCA